MRIAPLSLALTLVACAQPPPIRDDLPDSEFQIAQHHDVECFASIDDSLIPLIQLMKARRTGERGVAEVRVTRRDEAVFAVDAQGWDSGDEGTSSFHERQIFERQNAEGAEWCRTRVLYRPTR